MQFVGVLLFSKNQIQLFGRGPHGLYDQNRDDNIPTGIFYRNKRKLFTDKIPTRREKPLVKQTFEQEKTLSLLDDFF